MILCVEKLRDFCAWRGCVIFLTHSLRLHDLFLWRLPDFFLRRDCGIFGVIFLCVERLHDFFVERLHDSVWWTGCVISFVERLRDFVCGEVV